MKDLKLSLVIEALDRATAPLRKVGEALDHVKESTEHLHHAMHKLGLAEFIGASFFTGAALEFGRGVFELTDKVAEMGEAALRSSEATGASVEAMQRWSWAAKQLGVDGDGLTHAFAMMEMHVGGAIKGVKQSADALKLVGVSIKEARALSADPGALFGRIIEGYQSLKNPAAQAVAAQSIFSRSWTEMAPLLKAPKGEIAELMAQLAKAHVVMSTEDAEAAKKFELAKGDMGLAISGLGVRIGRELIPRLTEVIEKITDWIEKLKPAAIQHFTDAVGKLADELPKLLPKIEGVVVKIVELADKLAKASDNTTGLKMALGVLVAFMTLQAIVAIGSTAASLFSVSNAAFAAAGDIVLLLPFMESLTGAFTALNIVMDANPIGLVVLAITALIAAIAGVIFIVIEFHKHWDDIVKFVETGAQKMETAFAKLESKMPSWLQKALNTGGALLTFQYPLLGALGAGLDALAHAPPLGGHGATAGAKSAASPPHGGWFTPASFARGSAAAQDQSGTSNVIGTIVIMAEPGTKVRSMKASSNIELEHHRGIVAV